MKTKEQVIYEYWLEQRGLRENKREKTKAEKLEREELAKPEYTIGIVNDDGQLEMTQAEPVSKTVKLLPEVFSFLLFFFVTFALLENYLGAK